MVMKDLDNFEAYWRSIEQLQVHTFLVGLDEEFVQIHLEIEIFTYIA